MTKSTAEIPEICSICGSRKKKKFHDAPAACVNINCTLCLMQTAQNLQEEHGDRVGNVGCLGLCTAPSAAQKKEQAEGCAGPGD